MFGKYAMVLFNPIFLQNHTTNTVCIPAWSQIPGTPFTEIQVQCACEQHRQIHLTLTKVHNDFSPVLNKKITRNFLN